MSAYRVEVTREGDNWLADVPELQGAHTFARNLESLDQYVREVVVLAADLPDEAMPDVELDWDYRTGDRDLDTSLAELRAARRRMEAERDAVERATSEFAKQLSGTFSVRDVAALTGVSRARAQQLVETVARRAKPVGLPQRARAAEARPRAAAVRAAEAAASASVPKARAGKAAAKAAPRGSAARTKVR